MLRRGGAPEEDSQPSETVSVPYPGDRSRNSREALPLSLVSRTLPLWYQLPNRATQVVPSPFVAELCESCPVESQFPPEMLERIERTGVIAVLILDDASKAVPLAKALLDGGVDAMELTLRTDAAIDSLKQIRQQVPEMLAGIGTVLNVEQIDQIMDAGAQFAVSPGLNADVVRKARDAGLPFAPGVMTPTDIEMALQLGCRELKFFPAVPGGGLPMLNSIRAPYAHLGVRFVPLGGINTDNLGSWLSNDGVLAVGGSWLTPKDLIRDGNWTEITRLAAAARETADQAVTG